MSQLLRSALIILFANIVTSSGEYEDILPPPLNELSTSSYDVTLVFPTDDFETFTGKVTIIFEFANPELPDYVYLYASYDAVEINNVNFNNLNLAQRHYSVDKNTDVLKVFRPKELDTSKRFMLIIDYTGKINKTDDVGVYRKDYMSGNLTYSLLATNLAENYTRRAIPVFDESHQRSVFEVRVNCSRQLNVMFNSAVRTTSSTPTTRMHTFQKTPPMLPSGLSLVIGNVTCIQEKSITNYKFFVCSREDLEEDWKTFAKGVVGQMMAYFENYTRIDYSSFMGKMEQVFSPASSFQSTSGWGLIGAEENGLIVQESETTIADKKKVATRIAKAVSQQWFGNLVSPKSWHDQALLSQGFGEYFEYYALKEIFPSWELEDQFIVEKYHEALDLDISGFRQGQSGSRGACLLRMVEHLLGRDAFQIGLQAYLTQYALGAVEPVDLWTVLNDNSSTVLPETLQNIMENWTRIDGFPLLKVAASGGHITVTQETLSDSKAAGWYIPITFTRSTDSNKFTETSPKAWLTPNQLTAEITTMTDDEDWVILNNQETAYYRVIYDDNLWNKIKSALFKPNFDGILPTKRARLADDLFNLARLEKMTYYKACDILTFLREDTSYYTWRSALRGFRFLLEKAGENTELGDAISKTVLELIENTYATAVYPALYEEGDNYIDNLNKEQILYWTCRLGHENCTIEVINLFASLKEEDLEIDRNIRRVVYCNGLRNSNTTSDWDFVRDIYTNSMNDTSSKFSSFLALGCTRDPYLLERYLGMVVSDEGLFTSQDVGAAFASVYEENAEGVEVALDFFTNNLGVIYKRIGSLNIVEAIATGIANKLTTEAELEILKNVTQNHAIDGLGPVIERAAAVTESNLKWMQRVRQDLENAYIYHNSTFTLGPTLTWLWWAVPIFILFAVACFAVYKRNSIFFCRDKRSHEELIEMLEL